jgi:hypothetical protein
MIFYKVLCSEIFKFAIYNNSPHMSLACPAFEWLVILTFVVFSFRISVPKADYTFCKFSWISPILASKMPGYLKIGRGCSLPCALQFTIHSLVATQSCVIYEVKQEVLGRTSRILAFDTTRTAFRTTPPTILLCFVYSLHQEHSNRTID